MEYNGILFPLGLFNFQHFLFQGAQRPASDELFGLRWALSYTCVCVHAAGRCHFTSWAPSTLGPGISSEFVSGAAQTFANLSLCL